MPGQTGNQNVMLLIVRGAGDAGNNSKHRAESIVCAVDRIGHPTAAATMPAFALQDLVERGARANRRRHGAQALGHALFLQARSSAENPARLLLRPTRARLVAKFGFLLFFRRFHPANGDFGSRNFVPPAIESAADCVLQNGRLGAKISGVLSPNVARGALRLRPCAKECLCVFRPARVRPDRDTFAPSRLRRASCA